jgi:hypothetical protein
MPQRVAGADATQSTGRNTLDRLSASLWSTERVLATGMKLLFVAAYKKIGDSKPLVRGTERARARSIQVLNV